MESHSITTPLKSHLCQELEALYAEQHSPSSQLIQSALTIYNKTEIGFGTSYFIIPKAKSKEIATQAAQELHKRTPFLLAVIFDAITANKKSLQIDIPRSGRIDTSHKDHRSGHDTLSGYPKLISWLQN